MLWLYLTTGTDKPPELADWQLAQHTAGLEAITKEYGNSQP